jgi:hypothetical protein
MDVADARGVTRRLFAIAVLLHACSAEEPAPPPSVCPTGFLGDPAAAPIIELRALGPDGSDVLLEDGGDFAVW